MGEYICPVPSMERMRQGEVAIVECPERIACNPCSKICKFGAITMESVNDIPQIDFAKCRGCGLCLQICPGLAIYMVGYAEESAFVSVPYEFLPMPQKGQAVTALDRNGEPLCKGVVRRVVSREKSIGDTPVITVEVPAAYGMQARDFVVEA